MKAVLVLTMVLFMTGISSIPAEPPKVIGRWNVEVSFGNGETHSLRFDAQDSGKGRFTLLVPKPVSVGQVEGPAEWTRNDDGKTTFSGPVQFPLGNIGLLRGKLILRGQFQPDKTIAGEAVFFRLGEDGKGSESQPSKSGVFKATRLAE